MVPAKRTVVLAGVTLLAVVAAMAVGLAPATAAVEGGDEAVVWNVVDGDTVDVRFPDGTTDRVRFKGVDTPESGSTRNNRAEYDAVSTDCLKDEGNDIKEWMEHLEGERVKLYYDTKDDKRGLYDRLLAYVEYRGVNYSYMLVKTGRGRVTTDYPMTNQDRYTDAEDEARSANRGIWRCRTTNGTVDIESVTPTPAGSDTSNLADEYVVLEGSGGDTDLSGWTIADDDGNSYTFDNGTGLADNETLVLYTGTGSGSVDPIDSSDGGETDRDTVYMNRSTSVWDGGFENITLRKPDGTLANSRFYRHAPVETATNDASDVDWQAGDNRMRDVTDLETTTATFVGSDDGDTVRVLLDGRVRTVDLVGVNWPENGRPYKKGYEDIPDNAYGGNCLRNEAREDSEYPLFEQMEGEQVRLYFDPVNGKRYDWNDDSSTRLHVYLHYRGTDINRKLIAEGAARMRYPTFQRNPEYSRVEQFARENATDVWRCQQADKGGIGRVDIQRISADPQEDPDYTDLNDEYVVLENLGDRESSETGIDSPRELQTARTPVNLSGWTVSDGDGNSYTFGNVVLQPGEKVVLHTGEDPGTVSTKTDPQDAADDAANQRFKHVYWGRSTAVWDNDADTATVTAPDGRVATTRPYDFLTGPPGRTEAKEYLSASGTRTDDGDVFTKGQTNRVEVTVTGFSGPATRVAVNDSVPEGWRVLPNGDARNSGDVRTVELGTVTRGELEAAKANGKAGVTLTYFVEATGSSPSTTFGPATVTVRDERDAYYDERAEFAGNDTNVVVPASSGT